MISLSILEYEDELSRDVNNIEESRAFINIISLANTGKIYSVHIDVMRPPMIPDKSKFPLSLIRKLYEKLIGRIRLDIHLMVDKPINLLEEINKFIARGDRANITVIVQVESFNSEEEAINSIETVRKNGYIAGISLNLPTPEEKLTEKIVNVADVILLMSVPMGSGGQSFHKESIGRIRRFSELFPDKIIEVDGGINSETIIKVRDAGARIAVVGSYITSSSNPLETLLKIDNALKTF
jgi:ribulose-phosphate 3-epimerase